MKRISLLLALISFASLASCSHDPYVSRGQAGGAALGGLAGGLITDSWGGAAAGAVVGGIIGGEVNRNRW